MSASTQGRAGMQQQRHHRRQFGTGAINFWRHLSHGEADKMVADPQFQLLNKPLTGRSPRVPSHLVHLVGSPGDCKWTYQQNQGVIAALKKENRDLKALLAQLPASNKSGKAAVETELHGLDLQANSLRKQHDKLVQDRLSSTSKLALLRDSLKDLNTDSQLVFHESPGSRLVKQLQQKLAAALTKHDAAQSTCQSLEDTVQQLREHRQTHESQLGAVEEALTDMQAELHAALASHKAVQQAKDHAKAELALVEQQLLNDRAARDDQLQQHTSLVQQRQKEYDALHHGAMQRLQQWSTQLLHQQGGSVGGAVEIAADSTSSSDIQEAAGTDGLSTSASDTGLTSTAPAQAEHPAEASKAATAADLEQARTAGANFDAQEATSTAGVDSSSEAAASCPVDADSPADSSHKVDGKEPDAEQAEAAALNTHEASAPSAQAHVHDQQGAQDWPELSCKQAFAAIQFATGVTNVTDLVDRFLSQDDTDVTLHQLEQESQAYLQELHQRSATLQVTLEDLQLGRSLLHRQAEAAIKEADGQIKLNKEQYDQAGRLLVHVKASNL
ncbi:hypothetical protein WJX77_004042 [Trebouxia sp. C0004]